MDTSYAAILKDMERLERRLSLRVRKYEGAPEDAPEWKAYMDIVAANMRLIGHLTK